MARVGSGVAGILAAVCATAVVSCGSDAITLTVSHPDVESVELIDVGAGGPSTGDVRRISIEGSSADGEEVAADFELTTVGTSDGVEVRIVRGEFDFGDGDVLVMTGTAVYETARPTLAVGQTIERSILRGSGRFDGASGWVATTHNQDGSWTHVFRVWMP